MSDAATVGVQEVSSDTGVYFTDVFAVEPETLDEYGAFNISLVNDLPLLGMSQQLLKFSGGSVDDYAICRSS